MTGTTDRGAAAEGAAIKLFISYRRGDTAGFVHRLYEDLARKYGRESVFMDLDDIEPGKAFPEEIRAAAAAAKVFLVVIGARWSSIEDSAGNRRLEKPGDWVAEEVAAALGSDGDVVPVLVEGAPMPPASELPAAIQGLLARQAVEITPQRWDEDSRRLRKAIDGFLLGRRRRAPLGWALAAAALAAALVMLAWVMELTAVPGLRWSQRLLEHGLARRAPAALGDVWLVEVDDRETGLGARRELYAELVTTLAGAGTSVVAFDAVFDWEEGGGESLADQRFAASIAGAMDDGCAVVLGTSSLPRRQEVDGQQRLVSGRPLWLDAAVGRRWGHVCPAITPSDGGPFARIEVARLQHDPRSGLGRSGAIWPTLPLRAIMEKLGALSANYDVGDGAILLCGASADDGARPGRPCGVGRELLLRIPVEQFEQPPGSTAGNECLGAGADHLMVTLQLLPEESFRDRTRPAADLETLARARQPLVVVGSLREGPKEALGGLRGYQVHAQTMVDLLGGRMVRPAGLFSTLTLVALAALAGGLWRRRGRRPLAISEAPSPYRHWLLSAVDAAVAAAVVGGLVYLVALVVFSRQSVVLAVPYAAAACAIAYLLLALAERRRLA